MKRLMLTAVVAAALPAIAFAGEGTSSRSVSATGLDLARTSDAGVMAHRLDLAAMNVCGASEFSAREVQNDVRRSGCYREAVDRALAALSAPAVSAALRGRAQAPS